MKSSICLVLSRGKAGFHRSHLAELGLADGWLGPEAPLQSESQGDILKAITSFVAEFGVRLESVNECDYRIQDALPSTKPGRRVRPGDPG